MTIARLKRWGIAYYNRTAQDAVNHMKDRAKADGGLWGLLQRARDARSDVDGHRRQGPG